MKQKPVIRMVRDDISHETIEALQTLLEHAEQGKLIGFAFAAMYTKPDRHFVANTAGEAHRNPTFTRGMLRALDDHLGEQVQNM